MLRRIALLAVLPLLAACGSKSSGPQPISIQFGFSVPAGTEKTQCYVTKLSNVRPYDFARVDSHMSAGSHHLILYRDASSLLGGTPPAEGVGDCQMDAPRLLVYTTQEADHSITMPPGIAAELPPDALVILEAHYVNASTQDLQAHAEVTLTPMTEKIDAYAGILFFLDTNFSVPPGAGINGSPAYVHDTTCPVPAGIHVFRMGSHTHKRGLDVKVWQDDVPVATGKPAVDVSMIFENTNWETPAEKDWPDASPLDFGDNQAMHFQCSWQNETNQAIGFGPSANTDEMCIIGAGYWPKVSGPQNLDGNVFCADGTLYY
ncbi:MAG TPA: hypothetical protein VMV18_03810 [bacterium]|nr:hypothetical protein [bacterium]